MRRDAGINIVRESQSAALALARALLCNPRPARATERDNIYPYFPVPVGGGEEGGGSRVEKRPLSPFNKSSRSNIAKVAFRRPVRPAVPPDDYPEREPTVGRVN